MWAAELWEKARQDPENFTEQEVYDLYFSSYGPGWCVLDDDQPDQEEYAQEWFEDEFGRPKCFDELFGPRC